MMMHRLLPMLLLLLAWPAAAEPCPARRNVDCAGVARAVDAAILADPWLALLDSARAMRMAELARLLEPSSAAELARQDAVWRRSLSRELFFHPDGTLDEADPRTALRGALEYRLMLVMRLQHDLSASIEGHWRGVQGQLVVRAAGGGHYRILVSTADTDNLAWTCDYDGEGDTTQREPQWLRAKDGAVELQRVGTMLRLRMLTTQPHTFCGAGGSLAGDFFRIGDARISDLD